jgi:hypothetical protein
VPERIYEASLLGRLYLFLDHPTRAKLAPPKRLRWVRRAYSLHRDGASGLPQEPDIAQRWADVSDGPGAVKCASPL